MKHRFIAFACLLATMGSIPSFVYAAPASDAFQMDGQVDFHVADVNKQTQAFTGSKGADLGGVKDVRTAVASTIQKFLVVLGTLFLVYMIYAGYLILTSAGIEERVEKGKSILRNAIIGLIIILFSYAATWFVRWLFLATGDEAYKNCVPYSIDYNGDPLDASGNLIENPQNGC